LRLCTLEDRAVPATITVTNNNDIVAVDGTVSIREALDSINAGAAVNADVVPTGGPFGTADEVNFAGGLSPISLAAGQLTISKSVLVSGPGSALLTIQNTAAAGTTARVFNITGATNNVTIAGLTVTGGNATSNGGGIASGALTVLNGVVVSGNKTTTDGGGIAVSGGSLTLNNSTVDGNKVTTANEGGGIRVAGGQTITLNDSTVSNNEAGADGGGLYFFSGGTLNMNRSTVSGNKSHLLATGAGGGGIYLFNTITTITNSTISGNSTATAGKSSPGGGIASLSGTAAINIRNSTIAFNDAGTSTGGGFARQGTAVVTLSSTIISNNTATTNPDVNGTIGTANQSLIQNLGTAVITTNNGTQIGVDPLLGALTTAFGGVTAYHVPGAGSPALDTGNNAAGLATDQRGPGFPRVQNGTADVGSFEVPSPIPSASGGPYAPVVAVQPSYTFTVTYSDNDTNIDVSKLDNNDLQITGPGGPYGVTFVSSTPAAKSVAATYSVAPGGGFTDALNGTFTINVVAGEVFDTDIPTPLSVPAGAVGTFQVSIPTTYIVDATNDELIDTDGKTSLREAIALSNADVTTADTITFDPTVFAGASTITLALGQLDIGAAVTITGPAAALTVDAGGLSRVLNVDVPALSGQKVSVSNMTLTGGNSGAANGGGINNNDEALALTNVTVQNSTTTVDGGGISITSATGSLTLTNSLVTNNTGTGLYSNGGGINVSSASAVTISSSTVSNNSAGEDGGGIYFFSGGTLTMTNSTVSGNKSNTNTAGAGGGGIYLFSTVATIVQSTVSGNSTDSGGKASNGGGVVAQSASKLTVNNSTFGFNSATTKGGGIHNNGSATITLNSTIVSQNTAPTGADVNGAVNADFSLLSSSAGATITGASNVLDLSALLGPLALNGGTTANHIPNANVFNVGSNPLSLTLDQRGAARVQDGTIDIGSVESPAPLSTPPTGVATAPNITVAGGTINVITVVYTDLETNIDTSKLDNNDLEITGPGGPYSVVFVSSTAPAKTVTATYEVLAPGGTFDAGDNGTYTINIVAGQVFDTDVPPQSAVAGPIGSYKVAIAKTFVVNAINDESVDTDGFTSLREAIEGANANTGLADIITFDPLLFATAQTINLALGQLSITDAVTITGPAVRPTVDAGGLSRVLSIDQAGSSGNAVAISNLILTNGNAGTLNGGGILNNDEALTLTNVAVTGNTTSGEGGGIAVTSGAGSLNLVNSSVSNNKATGTTSNGGGIDLRSGSTVSLLNSTVSNNESGEDGGGLYFFFNGSLSVVNSTISGNKANQLTGGVGGGGVYFYGTATTMLIQNSTISGNSAALDNGGLYSPYGYGGGILLNAFTGNSVIQNSTIAFNNAGRQGGGIAQAGGTANWDSSIFARNTILGVDAATSDVFLINPTVVGGNNNLVGIQDAATKATFSGTTLTGLLATPLDPLLAPLANNGGPTQTHELLAGSPAVNQGNNVAALANDQRGVGFARVVGSAADIGAYEMVPPALANFKVNGGGVQRSMVTSLVIDFTIPVNFPGGIANAFQLNRVGNPSAGPQSALPLGSVNITAVQTAPNQVTITFPSPNTVPIIGGSLPDGRYDLTIVALQITGSGFFDGDGDGNGGDNRTENFHRLFGDSDGDADADAIDFGQFRNAFGTNNPTFDYDADNDVDAIDFGEFRTRFGANVP